MELSIAADAFERLEWDSEKFGFAVARIRSNLPADGLRRIATLLRRMHVVLAYYNRSTDHKPLSFGVLASLGGRLVDTRVTYRKELDADRDSVPVSVTEPMQIAEYTRSTVEPALVAIARESGRYSRFRVDPQIERRVFEAIYDAWIHRSVAREIADTVLVATRAGVLVGLVTLRVVERTANIGLLSVSAPARGAGLGRGLLNAAAAWAVDHGARRIDVATQSANSAARRLYESSGYAMMQCQRVYHLWLGQPRGGFQISSG